ncbi:SDR family NAD(P)-dependent oxidoreductase [Paraliobacillus zengyii]|uniref:SDR family NAD(P)-dependent oxidoreductase n=1 Tax=Paraliobacillus zengyii TaxID=2213194 RepID=UPI000DD2CB29|nr:SDR family NAD(P)-dependent oxidoreductase [Paraliobacillus zengyii]
MGSIAIVTGASSGIGREIVKRIDRDYPAIEEVWVVARREDRLVELAKEVFIKLKILPLDVARPESIETLKTELEITKSNVKLLVNAAGYGKFGKIGSLPLDEEVGMVRLNVEAMTAVTSTVLPYILSGGKIIQIASSAAFAPQPNFGIYAATKAFVLSYSRALNEELREKNITVTAVCPGPVKTEFFDVAETSNQISFMDVLPKTNPKDEARHALKDSQKGKAISTYGSVAKGFRIASKLLPVGVILLATRYYMKD